MSSLSFILCAVILVGAAQAARVARDDKYTDKYDSIDVDEVLKSDRLLDTYIKCMLDTGKCSPDSTELKKNLPDALTNDCSKCTPKQKDSSQKVVNYLIKNKADVYAQLETKYDPTGIFRKKYAAELDKIKA